VLYIHSLIKELYVQLDGKSHEQLSGWISTLVRFHFILARASKRNGISVKGRYIGVVCCLHFAQLTETSEPEKSRSIMLRPHTNGISV
jgi:hypothetical protein